MATSITHNNITVSVGDIVNVAYKIKEANGKDRIQDFSGQLIAIKGKRPEQNFVVMKKASDGINVERIFPLNSPWIESIKKMRAPKRTVRRAKLYYLRNSKARTL